MIIIKKLTKIDELFVNDTENIFDYTLKEKSYGLECLFTDDTGIKYTVNINNSNLASNIKGIEINYGIVSKDDELDFTPLNGKLDTNKLKIFNTVLNICKDVINKINPYIISFLGDISTGLASFYKMIVKQLKLDKTYQVLITDGLGDTFFTLIKPFDFIDNIERIYHLHNKSLIIIMYDTYGLSFVLTSIREKTPITLDIFDCIKYCIPDRTTIEENWLKNDLFIKFNIDRDYFYMEQSDIKKVISYLKNLGLTFQYQDDNSLTFYDTNLAKKEGYVDDYN